MRDILWLRWFAVAAALTNMPYFLLQSEVLWPPIVWAGVFTVINLYQIARIYLERRPVVLSDDEQRLYDLGFRSLRPRDFVSLIRSAARYMRWPLSSLRVFLDKRPELRVTLQSLVNRDLAGKVERLAGSAGER